MTPDERAAIVFDIVRDGLTVTEGDVTVTASDAVLDGDKVGMTLAATRSGVALELNNPFVFCNPPVAVRDGNDVIVDPYAAVAEMIVQAVG